MVAFRANLNQLDEVSGRLHAQVILANSAKRIFQYDLRERVQIRLSAPRDLNFRFEEQIQLAGKRAFRAARSFRNSLDAAKRFGAPRDNQTRVAESPFTQQNARSGFHTRLLRESLTGATGCFLQTAMRSLLPPERFGS
jgi:hypothetical protein